MGGFINRNSKPRKQTNDLFCFSSNYFFEDVAPRVLRLGSADFRQKNGRHQKDASQKEHRETRVGMDLIRIGEVPCTVKYFVLISFVHPPDRGCWPPALRTYHPYIFSYGAW